MTRFPQGTNAFAKSAVLATGFKRIYSVTAYNKGGSTAYLQLFDAASLPANGTVPLIEVAVPANGTASMDFGAKGIPVSSGAVAALSSTDATLTLASSSDGLFLGHAS